MNKSFPWNRRLTPEELAALETRIQQSYRPIHARQDFIRELRTQLTDSPLIQQSAPLAYRRYLAASLLGLAGVLSGSLLVMVGLRLLRNARLA